MQKGGLLTNDRLIGAARWALMVGTPTIEQIIRENGKREAFAITVHDMDDREVAHWEFNPGKAWEGKDYHMFAEGKARASVRTGMDSGDILPQEFEPGEFPHPGAVFYPGFVVAGSGVEPALDVICARIIAETIQAALYGDLFRITRVNDGLLPAD